MLSVDGYNITLTQGDSTSLRFDFYNTDDTPYNLSSGEKVCLIVKRNFSNPDVVIYKEETNPGENYVTFNLISEDTESVECGIYIYNIRIVNASNVFTPFNTSMFKISEVAKYEPTN